MKGKFIFTCDSFEATRYNLTSSSQFGSTSPITANPEKSGDAKPRVYVQTGYDRRVAEETLRLQRLLLVDHIASVPGKSRFLFVAPRPSNRKGGDFHEADDCVVCSESGSQDSDRRRRYGGGTQGVVMVM
jgi:hypothetical protein